MESYNGKADLVNVYIKEAHPSDGWKVDENEAIGVCYLQPRTLAARIKVAKQFIGDLDIASMFVVDGIDNAAMDAFAAHPERLFGEFFLTPKPHCSCKRKRTIAQCISDITAVIEGGEIVYRGGLGPFQYSVNSVAEWLQQRFGEDTVAHAAPL